MNRLVACVASAVIAGFVTGSATAQVCVGDCDENGEVAINEVIVCVGVILGSTPLAQCTACDPSGDTSVEITELIAAVSSSLGTCLSASGTPSVTPTATPTPLTGPVQQCCVPAYYVWNCEDRTTVECATLGGIEQGPGVCSPNPCADLPPSNGHGICCLPNAAGDEIECEDRASAGCVAAGGVVKTGTVCLPETCADVPPPNPDVRCCLGEGECEDRTASACAAAGGVSMGIGVCAPDTCANVSPPGIQCCVPKQSGTVFECENRTPEQCAARGGVNMGPGDCVPDPCAP